MNADRQMRSYKLTKFGAPLTEIVESPPVPVGTQVLLRVRACGVCHSDIHLSDGYLNLGRERKVELSGAIRAAPHSGDEIVGVVDELGPDASGVQVGDRRVADGRGGCGQCAVCRTGREISLRAAETSAFAVTGVSAITFSWIIRGTRSSSIRSLIVCRNPRVFGTYGIQRAEKGGSGRRRQPAFDHRRRWTGACRGELDARPLRRRPDRRGY